MFIVRKSDHIEADLQRNWSSWNYGEDGVTCTKEELDNALANLTEESPLIISGYEIFPNNLNDCKFGELYDGYWVLIDTFHGTGLSCNILEANSVEEAINAVSTDGFEIELGEGDMVDCSDAKVVYSNGDIHIIEVL